jgi:hypothetical protein
MKFKEGDVVIIKPRDADTKHLYPTYVEEMSVFAGWKAIVVKVNNYGRQPHYSLKGVPFHWHELWLEPCEEDFIEKELFEI